MPGTADPATNPWLWSSQAPGVNLRLSLYQMDTASHWICIFPAVILVQPSDLTREVSLCSRWQLT